MHIATSVFRVMTFAVLVAVWGGQAQGITPTDVSDLRLWLDAGVGVASVGDQMTWADQSGNGNNADAFFDEQPTLVSNVLNGLPALRFNGTSNFLDIPTQILTSPQLSIFAMVNATGTGQRHIISNWTINGGIANAFGAVWLGTSDTPSSNVVRFGTDLTTPNALTGLANHFLLSAVSSATDMIVYQNGTLLGSRGSGPTQTGNNLAAPYRIGQQGSLSGINSGNGEFWQGDILELLVYNKAVTDAERIGIANYFDAKYQSVVPEPTALVVWGLLCALGSVAFPRLRR